MGCDYTAVVFYTRDACYYVDDVPAEIPPAPCSLVVRMGSSAPVPQPSPWLPGSLCRWRGAVVVERRTRASSTRRWIGARECLLALVASSTQSSAVSSASRHRRVVLVAWLVLRPDLRASLIILQGLRVWTTRLTETCRRRGGWVRKENWFGNGSPRRERRFVSTTTQPDPGYLLQYLVER